MYHTKKITVTAVELMGENSTVRLPGRSYVFMDTESVGSCRNHLNILVWRVFGHATASRADAGPCTLN